MSYDWKHESTSRRKKKYKRRIKDKRNWLHTTTIIDGFTPPRKMASHHDKVES